MTDQALSFDVSSLSAADQATIEINHPVSGEPIIVGGQKQIDPTTGEEKIVGGVPMSVTVYGPGSKPFAAAKAANSTKSVERIRRKGKVTITADEEAASTATFLTACTVSFNGFNYRGLEGSEQFRACYADPTMGWLTEQVNREMGEWANFTKPASNGSVSSPAT